MKNKYTLAGDIKVVYFILGLPALSPNKHRMNKGEILIYQNQQGSIKIDVRLDDETVWLTQAQLCEFFQKSKATISEHIKHVFEEGELNEDSAIRKFRTVQIEGNKSVQKIDYYKLDVINASC